MANSYSEFTQKEIDAHDDYVYDLRVQIKRLHATIGRMFEKGHITSDMIAEALDENVDPDNIETLKVIYTSWGGNAHFRTEAAPKFSLILKTIRSYQ